MQRKRKPLTQLTFEGKRPKNGAIEPNSNEQLKAGTILRIVMRNFMCHSHLEVAFNNNINYIIGRNGSGKSAILTALIVGLGGRASLTNRGNSIKGFVKTGKNSATIEIMINNNGPLAYRYNHFGDKIIIIRTFTAGGNGSYKIKSASGEIISTHGKEVHRICTNLNIQVDNPICLLNQDTARNFLSSKNPSHKFILFMKATGLETLYAKYQEIKENTILAEQMYEEKKQLYQRLQSELSELNAKIENHKSIAKLNQRIMILENELFWAIVRDSEEELHEFQENVNKLKEECAQVQNEISSTTENRKRITEQIQNFQQQIHDLQNSIEDQNAPQRTLVDHLSGIKDTLNEKHREKRSLQKSIALKTGQCAILEDEIKNITTNFAKVREEKQKRLEEIKSLEGTLKTMTDLLSTSENDQSQMRNFLKHLQEEEYNLKSELQKVNLQIENTKSNLSAFNDASSNELSLYDRDMPRIIEEIKRMENRFTHLPRGPLGSYIKLKDKKWAVAVEGFINTSMLRAFIVHNKNDNQLLMSIFQKYQNGTLIKPMIITTPFFFKVHDVKRNLVQPIDGCISIYDALEISDPVVANCLIDELSVESALLIPSTEKAIELMSEQRRVPRHCHQGITITGDKYYPDPNYRMYCSRYHTVQYLQSSKADVIRQFEEKLKIHMNQKKDITNRYNLKREESAEHLRKMKDIDVKVAKLTRGHLQTRCKYEDLINVTEPDVGNVQKLENELSELKQILTQNEAEKQQAEDHIRKLSVTVEEKEEELHKIKNICRSYEDRLEFIQEQLQQQNLKLNETNVNKGFISRKLNKCSGDLHDAQRILDEKINKVKQQTKEASKFGQRVQDIRDVKTITDERNHNKSLIRQIESDMESIEELMKKLQQTTERFNKATEFMNSLNENIEKFHVAYKKREQYYKCTQDYFKTFIMYSFEQVLKLRQFRGNIDIDMKNKKLDLVVIPQQGSQGLTTTSNLSGGERSFSTVAFLYSLWQCTEFPFYFLDEFDVFMDKANRSKVMDILIHHAKANPELQFVFLTPQDVSFVKDKAVAVHRLDDPERSMIN